MAEGTFDEGKCRWIGPGASMSDVPETEDHLASSGVTLREHLSHSGQYCAVVPTLSAMAVRHPCRLQTFTSCLLGTHRTHCL